MFRYKRSIPVPYDVQGYIYFTSRLYQELPRGQQEKIRTLCREAGGDYADALLAFVTTDYGKQKICADYYISESTLERIVKRYYLAFAEML